MADQPVLSAIKIARSVNDRILWSNISFDVYPGEIWFLRGPSGIGKTLLLRAVACLDPLEAGMLRLHGQSPTEVGITCWRAQVMYVHQSRVNYKGSPQDLFNQVQQFASQKGRPRGDLSALVQQLGLEAGVLQQSWAELSGGQAQRVSLAIAIALQPKVLLLDEPTSACDSESTLRVEAVLKSCSSAIIWVTHDDQQPQRVGGKLLELPSGTIGTISPMVPPVVPSSVTSSPIKGGTAGATDSSSSTNSSSTTAVDGSTEIRRAGQQEVEGNLVN